MYKRILVPVNGSEFPEVVIPQARRLAAAIGATLTVLGIAENPSKVVEADDYVRRLAGALGAECRTVTASGGVSEAILSEAAWHPGTLVAISAHGRVGMGTAILGSVARQVVHASREPVLIYRPDGTANRHTTPGPVRTVVLPLDRSPRSESMQEQAVDWATALGAELTIVHVAQSGSDRMADAYLAERAADIAGRFGVEASRRVLLGDPAEALAGFVADRGDVLVVMAARNQPPLRAAVLGSVTTRFMHLASVPVIVKAAVASPA